MPFRYSNAHSAQLGAPHALITDLRNAPIRGRKTVFRLMQQNALAYTFDAGVPGWAAPGINGMPFDEVVEQAMVNAEEYGRQMFASDFVVDSAARAKVAGDVYETVTTAVLWNASARWNAFMRGASWAASPRYARPSLRPARSRQVAVLNLPRRYDWVKLLTPTDRGRVAALRVKLNQQGLTMPTSTPDIAVVVLPESEWADPFWIYELANLSLQSQKRLDDAVKRLEGRIEAGEMILAIALKRSLRSDRLYQPLYEANVMQYLLEEELGAPRVEFEVHALDASGTNAREIYKAVSFASIASGAAHRAVRELYEPTTAAGIVQRHFDFLGARMSLVPHR